MPPITILFPFTGDTVGGSHLSALELVLGLDERRFRPVVAVHENGPLQNYLLKRNIPFVEAPRVTYTTGAGHITTEIVRTLFSASSLAGFLLRNGIDIVHTNDNRMHLTWSVACKLANTKFVWHQRTTYNSRRLNIYARLSDRIITISDYCRSAFIPYMCSRAQVVNNPFSSRFSTLDRREQRKHLLTEMGAAEDDKIVGFVSNFTERKRPLLFVDVAARLRDRLGHNVVFPMIGAERGALGDDVRRRIATYGLEERCRLLGPRFPVEPLLCGFDVLLAPAVSEGFGRTLVEAMYCRVPVIAADDGGHQEIISHNMTGILVQPDDVDAFAEMAMRVLENREFSNALVEKAAISCQTRFSVDAHVTRVQAVYDSLVD